MSKKIKQKKTNHQSPTTNHYAGFSFIELLTAIAIMGMLAVMSVPGITRNMRENAYNNDIEKIWSLFNEARVNALVSKRCPNENEAGVWRFSTSGLIPAEITLSCGTCSDPDENCWREVETYTAENPSTTTNITAGESLLFLPKTARAKLGDGTEFKLAISDPGFQKCTMITLNPVAGFPERKKYENTTDCPPSSGE